MDNRCLELAEDFVSTRYIEAGRESLQATSRVLRSILAQRRCPDKGLSDAAIQLLLRQLALMDTNNFAAHVGGGEREGRVLSALVRQRHFDLTHGIGRSGDLVAEQPKAAGSSLLYQLTNVMMLDLIRLAGAPSTMAAVVVPMATGMTLALVLRCVAEARRKEVAQLSSVTRKSSESQRTERVKRTEETGTDVVAAVPPSQTSVTPQYVIWPRIDQKTALKCIDAAGLTPVPVQLRRAPPLTPHTCKIGASAAVTADSSCSSSSLFLQCDVADIAAAVDSVGGAAHVVCVLSTTSCFAPRLPDNTVPIAQYCKTQHIPYVVNNAYGVQSRRIMTRLDAAQRLGRVDYFVLSGDKNFLVPVGGSVVCSSSAERCHAAAALYAGRASASPIVDLFITALSVGRQGMQALWAERYRCRRRLVQQLRVFASERGESVLVDDVDDGDADTSDGVGVCGACVQVEQKDTKRASHLPRNDISIAVTMRLFGRSPTADDAKEDSEEQQHPDSTTSTSISSHSNWAAARAFGARLFRSAVTGPRVVLPAPSTPTTIAGCTFHNYGMHQEGVPTCPLLIIACGIGMTVGEVDALMCRLRDLWPVSKVREATKEKPL